MRDCRKACPLSFAPRGLRNATLKASFTPEGAGLPARSVQLSLLGLREQREHGVARPQERVQLRARHWIVRNAAGGRMQEVRGEGVNGATPALAAGERESQDLHPPWIAIFTCCDAVLPGNLSGAVDTSPGPE